MQNFPYNMEINIVKIILKLPGFSSHCYDFCAGPHHKKEIETSKFIN